MKRPATLLLFFLTLVSLSVPPVAADAGEGWLVTARRTERQFDLWASPATGGPWQPLTRTAGDERWPAWSPDGSQLAYAARRDRNWDIYTLDLRTGKETRRTTHPHFEGWPAWSPDGKRLAFASAREGDLDLFVMALGSGEETNLTFDSSAHDFEPRWQDDDTLLFVSTRDRTQDLFRYELKGAIVEPVTQTEELDERGALVLPHGGLLVLEQRERSSGLRALDGTGQPQADPFSWSGTTYGAALAPGGEAVAWLEHHIDGDVLYRSGVAGEGIHRLTGPLAGLEGVAWGKPEGSWWAARLGPPEPGVPPSPPEVLAADLTYLDDLATELPRLNSRVVPAFEALRARVLGESGRDFLGEVSETLRPIGFASDESDYFSWHKAGRAVDTLLDLGWRGGYQLMDVVREDRHGDVYWRIWLRCPVQDGSCGEPLVEAPWDTSYEARWVLSEGQGGLRKPFQAGYYVDFTRLAADEGWERISSYETPEFDWRQNSVAMEYWHYQHSDGLSWYEAMTEVYAPAELDEWYSWEALAGQEKIRWKLLVKGLPLPAAIRQAPAELVMP